MVNVHIPSAFKENHLESLYQLIEDYPLWTLVSSVASKLDANHIPFYLNKANVGSVTLQSHIAKANNLWRQCCDGQSILLVFHGPNAYISPNFYPSKQQNAKVVPTWNYAVVHVRGRIYFKHDSKWILQLLEKISDIHESNSQDTPWSVSDAPADFIAKLIKAVVGLEIEIDDIVGNFKLSQNKTDIDYQGVSDTLKQSNKENEQAVYKRMRANNLS